jgi:hypothetical protein
MENVKNAVALGVPFLRPRTSPKLTHGAVPAGFSYQNSPYLLRYSTFLMNYWRYMLGALPK